MMPSGVPFPVKFRKKLVKYGEVRLAVGPENNQEVIGDKLGAGESLELGAGLNV